MIDPNLLAAIDTAIGLSLKHRQLPALLHDIVPQDVGAAVVTLELEVPVVGSQPAVEDFDDLDSPGAEPQLPRSLLAPVARVALDAKIHESALHASV